MDTTRGRLPDRSVRGPRHRGPLATASVALAVATASALGVTGCSTTADEANTPGVVVATSPAAPAPTASATTDPTQGTPSPTTPSATATPSGPDDSTPTTSSVPDVTGTQTQPPGAVRILPIKPADRSPAAARAVDTAAAYVAAAGVTQTSETVATITRLSASSCIACNEDIANFSVEARTRRRLVSQSNVPGWKYTEIKYLGRKADVLRVSALVIQGPTKLVDRNGKIIQSSNTDRVAEYSFLVADRGGRPLITSFTLTAQ